MKRTKIFALVKNFEVINYDVDIYQRLDEAKKEFEDYTGFKFNMHYSDPHNEKYSKKFSESKIFELEMPGFIELKKGDSSEKDE